eukprot:s2087_g16.t1
MFCWSFCLARVLLVGKVMATQEAFGLAMLVLAKQKGVHVGKRWLCLPWPVAFGLCGSAQSRTSSAPKIFNETPFEECLRGNALGLLHASLCRVCKQPRKELLWSFMFKNKQPVGLLSDSIFFLPFLTWIC